MKVYTDRMIKRLRQRTDQVRNANEHTYWHRVREFRHFCETTLSLAHSLAQLPQVPYDWNKQLHEVEWPLGDAVHAFRWDAIKQFADCDSKDEAQNLLHRVDVYERAFGTFTQEFVIPLSDYLVYQLEGSSAMLYLLLRYKRWAEWFETERLRGDYGTNGEEELDRDLRRFLFESGIDYPYSQPVSPSGQADVVAGLETDDPLVLEIKVWDSKKGYKENRVRDGLRQVMNYAAKWGKDKGYVVVFNLEPEPLVFVSEANAGKWPARIERGGSTYYFIAIDIAEQPKPVSQRDRGKRVKRNEVRLKELWDSVENA